jgi:hypothetical protein
MPKFGIALLICIAVSVGSAQPAAAIPYFLKVYLEEYKKDIESQKDKAFPEFVAKKAKCYICHQGKKSKKNNNIYGLQLKPLLDKKKNKENKKDAKLGEENKQKIIAALKKVSLLHTDPKDKKSPTYGELIKQGKLPGGKLEDAMKEPKKEEKKTDSTTEKPAEL